MDLSPSDGDILDTTEERGGWSRITLDLQRGTAPCRQRSPGITKDRPALAEHYGFTEEEVDFINYDIKYRMGREG